MAQLCVQMKDLGMQITDIKNQTIENFKNSQNRWDIKKNGSKSGDLVYRDGRAKNRKESKMKLLC